MMVYSERIIGVNIRRLRNNTDLSMDELADLLDISTSYLGLVERGQRRLSIKNLCAVTEIFNITLEALFSNYNHHCEMQNGNIKSNVSLIAAKSKNLNKLNALLHGLDHTALTCIENYIKALLKYRDCMQSSSR